jgi:hypothetical protein
MSLKSGLIALGFAGFLGFAAIVGCSASGDSGVGEDTSPTNPDDGTSHLPPPSSNGEQPADAGKDANKSDGAKQDSGYDAGPPPPTPGTACTTLNEKKSKTCGMCGKAETICLDDGSGKTGKWSDYGPCENETGVCKPGDTQACGNCGTQTCTNYCAWSACGGQPANSCSPGTIDYTTAGCATPGSYRNRTCSGTCTWSNYSATCEEPNNPNKLTIAGAVNGTVTGSYNLTAAKVGKRPPLYTCNTGALSTTADYPYELVELRNDTGKTASVTVTAPKGAFRVTIASYNTNIPPQTDAALVSCTDADYNFTSYDAVITLSMPANARYLVRITSYYAMSDVGQTSTGTASISAVTTALN